MSNETHELKLAELENVNGGIDFSAANTGPYVPVKTLADVVNSIKNQSK